ARTPHLALRTSVAARSHEEASEAAGTPTADQDDRGHIRGFRREAGQVSDVNLLVRAVSAAHETGGCSRWAMPEDQLAGASELPGPPLAGGVVQRQYQIGLGRQGDPPLDDPPGCEQIAQTDDREVGPQGCPEQG